MDGLYDDGSLAYSRCNTLHRTAADIPDGEHACPIGLEEGSGGTFASTYESLAIE
jgi:hypothetical protein